MAQLYLPAAHTEADLVLAGQIAERIDSGELYVTWTPSQGTAVPEVMAELREPGPRWTATIVLLFRTVYELWTLLLAREPQRPVLPPAADGTPAKTKPAA